MQEELYTRLNSDNREIRLVRLHPYHCTDKDQKDSNSLPRGAPRTISGSLEPVSLNNEIQYTALSYVWGDVNDTLPILLNGIEVSVTKNLLDALLHVQDDGESIILWVDAICINQKDDIERTAQILQMRSIYESAQKTFVWLGLPADGSDDIMQFFYETSNNPNIQNITRMNLEQRQHFPAVLGQLMNNSPALAESMRSPAVSELQSSIDKLLHRPYWYRVWCLQELAVSKNVVIACGNKRMSIQAFETAMHDITLMLYSAAFQICSTTSMLELGKQNFLSGNYKTIGTAAHRMLQQRSLHPNNRSTSAADEGWTLFQLLFDSYVQNEGTDVALRSTDRRDKIYGLLGLAADEEKLEIKLDCKKTWQEVYIETSTMLLRHTNAPLLVLCQGEVKDRADLPSWVVDWRQGLTQSPSIREWDHRPFIACGAKKLSTEWIDTQTPLVFTLKGAKVDKIQQTGLVLDAKNDDYLANGFTSVLKFLGNIESYYLESLALDPNVTPYTQTSLEEARWRIPVGDMEMITAASGQCRRATNTSAEGYQSLVHIARMYEEMRGGGQRNEAAMAMLAMSIMQNMGKFSLYLVMIHLMRGRRPFISSSGYVGLGPAGMLAGDLIVVLFGSRSPFVLRPVEGDRYRLIGEAYVHGIMDGEYMDLEKEEVFFHLC